MKKKKDKEFDDLKSEVIKPLKDTVMEIANKINELSTLYQNCQGEYI